MIQTVKDFSKNYSELMEERERESFRLNSPIHILPHQMIQCTQIILDIWNDDAIKEVYERRRFLTF